ncbi:MAG: hypothetical protein WA632_04855 [Gallionella sp.]
MRTLITATAVTAFLSSCVSAGSDDLVRVYGSDQPPVGEYNTTKARSATPHDKFFTVNATIDALRGYGLSPARAVAEITTDIVSTHGYCPHGYSVSHPPFTGSYRNGISWTIICND